jgi:ABC-type Fe3+-siderophore transport system permease subunit
MKFIQFTIIYLLFTIGYLAYLLSKLEPLHVHEIALTFIAIGSMLAGGVSLLSVLNDDKTDFIDQDDNIL